VLIVLDFLVSFAAAKNLLPYTITRFFDGDSKVNFPTGAKTTFLLSAVVLMLCCWAAGRRSGDRAARGWLLLALVTGFAFIDETTFLHQSLSDALQKAFHFSGVLKYSWTIIYLPAGLLVGIFLLRNLRFMLPEVRNRLLPGGAVYVIGAMALEPIKSRASEGGENSVTFKLTAAVSDSLELAGLALLVCALLVAAHLLARGFTFSFRMGAGRPATSIQLPPDNYPQPGAHAWPAGHDQQGGYPQPAFPQSGGFPTTEQDYPTAAFPQGYRPPPRSSAQQPPDPSQQWADPSAVSHAGGPPPPADDPFSWPR